MLFTRYKQHRLNESPCVGSVFKADAVNEEDSERDRATQEEEVMKSRYEKSITNDSRRVSTTPCRVALVR
jgi:hypothetical protein